MGKDKEGRLLDDTLLDINSPKYQTHGFPMSSSLWQFMKDKKLFFGRSVRNAATISLKSEKFRKNFANTLLKLFYRAVLQIFLSEHCKGSEYHVGKCKVKNMSELGFSGYCHKVIKDDKVKKSKALFDFIQIWDEESLAANFKKFRTLYFIKALLSPLIEITITLDRLLYIEEYSQQSQIQTISGLKEVFNKEKSTRNLLLWSKKLNN